MNKQIKEYCKITPMLLMLVFIYSNSFAGFHLGLGSAVKTKVQELKDKQDQKLEEKYISDHAPVITSLTANPTSISVGSFITLTCNASDPDKDPLTYTWSATDGVVSGTGSQITWIAPTIGGAYTISCTVSNGKGGATRQSVNVNITPVATKVWTKLLATSGFDESYGVATDPAGNIYITGWTDGNLDGNTNQGSHDVFLTKYDANGTRLWTKQLGTIGFDEGFRVATDTSGNIYITVYSEENFEGLTESSISLVKFDTDGAQLWTRQLGTGWGWGLGIATDQSDNVYVTGWTEGSFTGYTNQGSEDAFLAKYDTNGAQLWAKQFGTSGFEQGLGVATDPLGNAYVTGWTDRNLDGNINQGAYDIFLTKFDTNGAQLWTKQLGTDAIDEGTGIALDASGNIFITGWTSGGLDGNSNQGAADILLIKFDNNGTKLWTKQYGSSGDEQGVGVAIDQSGLIYVTGWTMGNLDGSTGNGKKDIFITKYSTNGTKLWTRAYGTYEIDVSNGVAVDLSGNIYISGYTWGDLDSETNQGAFDAFLTKFAP